MTRVSIRNLLGAVVLTLCVLPAQAHAEAYVDPWLGVNFGTNTENLFDTEPSNGQMAFGVNAGAMGAGIFGVEVGFGYGSGFFGPSDDFGSNTVWDLMGNLIVGIPFGGTQGAGVRPFVTGGIGLVRSEFDTGAFVNEKASDNSFAWNLGAGVMGYFSDHVGIRGDVRFLKTTSNELLDRLDLSNDNLHYWRTTIGVVFR